MKWNKVDIFQQTEEDITYPVLEINVNRFKTEGHKTTPDEMLHFAHSCKFHEDLLFNMFYHRVIAKHNNKVDIEHYLYPSWKKLVKFIDGKVKSNTSAHFQNFWKKMAMLCEKYSRN